MTITPARIEELRRQRKNDVFPCVVVHGKELDAFLDCADENARLRELLRRVRKYAHEDRAITPGVTRLARVLVEIDAALASPTTAKGG